MADWLLPNQMWESGKELGARIKSKGMGRADLLYMLCMRLMLKLGEFVGSISIRHNPVGGSLSLSNRALCGRLYELRVEVHCAVKP